MTSHSCYELSSEKDHNVAQRKLLAKDFEHLGQNSVCLSCLSLPCSPGDEHCGVDAHPDTP